MAMDRPRVADFVKETTDTEGIGAFTLAGPVSGFKGFSVLSDGAKVYYSAVDNPDAITAFEQGIGTYTAGSPATVSRDRVISSSNGNARVSWAPGTKTIIITAAAELLNAILDTVDSDLKTTGTATAYALATYRPGVGLFEGRFVCAKFHVANGASPTLNVDGTGAKAIVDINGSAPPAGSMPASYYFLKYDATAGKWVVFSPFNMGAASSKNLGADIVDDGSGNLTRKLTRVGRTANVSFAAADRGKRHRFEAAGKTGTLMAAATAGDGWNIEIEDAAGGTAITSPATNLYVNGAAAAASYTFTQGESGSLICNGTSYYLITNKPPASTSVPGVVRKATSLQVAAETADRYPDAAGLKYHPAVAKAWVRFDGATGNIIAGYNVASVARPSQGNYTVNFANAMANADYAIVVSCSLNTSRPVTVAAIGAPASISTASFPITIRTQDGGTPRTEDAPVVTAIVYGV